MTDKQIISDHFANVSNMVDLSRVPDSMLTGGYTLSLFREAGVWVFQAIEHVTGYTAVRESKSRSGKSEG